MLSSLLTLLTRGYLVQAAADCDLCVLVTDAAADRDNPGHPSDATPTQLLLQSMRGGEATAAGRGAAAQTKVRLAPPLASHRPAPCVRLGGERCGVSVARVSRLLAHRMALLGARGAPQRTQPPVWVVRNKTDLLPPAARCA
jgi:hypothetical protein